MGLCFFQRSSVSFGIKKQTPKNTRGSARLRQTSSQKRFTVPREIEHHLPRVTRIRGTHRRLFCSVVLFYASLGFLFRSEKARRDFFSSKKPLFVFVLFKIPCRTCFVGVPIRSAPFGKRVSVFTFSRFIGVIRGNLGLFWRIKKWRKQMILGKTVAKRTFFGRKEKLQ